MGSTNEGFPPSGTPPFQALMLSCVVAPVGRSALTSGIEPDPMRPTHSDSPIAPKATGRAVTWA
ncbi:hypothetical protein AB0M95_14430 [Sphaerisporangium sp. NPDC051017]|uniref:hypothetical protein n=1 Tax=Sphaerisporangium sp. NPDC051017 TaxID=3154636 RepID=UPI003447F71C